MVHDCWFCFFLFSKFVHVVPDQNGNASQAWPTGNDSPGTERGVYGGLPMVTRNAMQRAGIAYIVFQSWVPPASAIGELVIGIGTAPFTITVPTIPTPRAMAYRGTVPVLGDRCEVRNGDRILWSNGDNCTPSTDVYRLQCEIMTSAFEFWLILNLRFFLTFQEPVRSASEIANVDVTSCHSGFQC